MFGPSLAAALVCLVVFRCTTFFFAGVAAVLDFLTELSLVALTSSYLEDLDPLTIACVGGRLSVRSASNERRNQTNKCGSDIMRSGAKSPHRGVSLAGTPRSDADRRK